MKTIVTLIAALCLSVASTPADTVTLRADHWYPYNGDPADAKPGYVIEIMREVLKGSNTSLDYQIMPWKRAVAETEKGNFNGIIGALKSDAPTFVFPAEPIGKSGTEVFAKAGSTWKYDGVKSLESIRLGVVDGYSYGEEIDAYIEANKSNPKRIDLTSGEATDDVAIKKLQAGRIDAFAGDPNVFRASMKNHSVPESELVSVGVVAEPEPIYIALSPKKPDSPALAEKISAGIAELRKSGRLKEILSAYGVSDWAN